MRIVTPDRLMSTMAQALMLLLSMAILASGCKPSFEEQDDCAVNGDCFSDEVCSLGKCIEGEVTPDTQPVQIVSFTSSASTIEEGEEVTISWEMADAVTAKLSFDNDMDDFVIAEDALEEGSTTVTLAATTTLTLEAQGSADGDAASSMVTITVNPFVPEEITPVIESFNASSTLIKPGESTTLSWTIKDADRAELDDGTDVITLEMDALESGSLEVTPASNTNYVLRAYNEDRMVMRTVQLIVQGDAPQITAFTADQSRVEQGSDVTLSWEVTGAETLVLEDESGASIDLTGLSVTMDTLVQTLSTNKSFTLTAENEYGQDSQSVSVVTYEPLVIDSFTSDLEFVNPGDEIVLSWEIAGNPSSVTITRNEEAMPLDLMGASNASGSLTILVTEESTYKLVAENGDGDMAEAMVTVSLLPPFPVINSFTASNSFVAMGETVTLSWDISHATMITLVDDLGASIDVSTKMVDTDMVDVVVDTDRVYTITASNLAGANTKQLLIAVGEPVTAQLMADAATINAGDPLTLSWTTTNASQIALTNSLGETIDLTGKSVDADSITLQPGSDVTYTLTAQGFAGPVTSSVMVSVNAVVSIRNFSAASSQISLGDSTTLSWDIQDGTSFTLTATDSSGTTPVDTTNLTFVDSVMVSPTETTTYELVALGDMGDMDTLSLTVVVTSAPTIDTFVASPDTISTMLGESSTLSWTTSNATQIELLDIDAGMPVPFTNLGHGAGEAVVQPSTTTSYMLLVGNAVGQTTTQIVTVTVTP